MARRIGCCTWIFGAEPLTDMARRARACGLDGVELLGERGGRPARETRAILADQGLEVFSMTPTDADPSHPDAAERRKALDYYRDLADFAAELGAPMFAAHGRVGRVRPLAGQEAEDALLIEAAAEICALARERGLRVVFEILNRYESHQVRTVAEGLRFLQAVGADNLFLLPDAYHMNIEEADPAAALRAAGSALGLYHAADSNRGGVGEGHIDFGAQIRALDAIGYAGPIVLEPTAPGSDPFTPVKGPDFRREVERQLTLSAEALRALGA